MLAAVVAVLAAFAPAAMAQSVLPDPRTHVDLADSPAGAAGSGDPDSPRLTYLRSDTHQSDVRAGYLYVLIRCNFRCDAEITATTKIAGKRRVVAKVRKTLRTNRITRVRMKIRSDVRRRIAAGAIFRFEANPFPPTS